MRLYFPNLTRPKSAAKYLHARFPNTPLHALHGVVARTCGYEDWHDLTRNYAECEASPLDEDLGGRAFQCRLANLVERLSPQLQRDFSSTLDLLTGSRLIGSRAITDRDREEIAAVLSTRHLAERLHAARSAMETGTHPTERIMMARKSLADIIRRFPALHTTGLGTTTQMSGSVGRIWPNESELASTRAALLNDHVPAFIECQEWLWRTIRLSRVPKNAHSSYKLKHEVERVRDIYVPAGAFIAAALDAGLIYSGGFFPAFNLCLNNVLHAHKRYRRPDGSPMPRKRIPGIREHLDPQDVRSDPRRFDPCGEYALYSQHH